MQHCNCRLTLAWFTSENSTKQLECRLILAKSSSLSLDPISCQLVSPLRCPVPTASLRRPSPTARSSSFFQLSLLASPCSSGHCEISSPKPFVGFRAKTDKGIVCLAGHLHSVTYLPFLPLSFTHKKLQHPTEHRGILTTPTQRFQEDFSIHLQRYSIFQHFAPFSNPSEHRGILTTPTQQFRSIFGLVSLLSLRPGSISNLCSLVGVITGIMFRKALWNSPPTQQQLSKEPFFSSQHLASNPYGFSKDKKKNKAIDTIS